MKKTKHLHNGLMTTRGPGLILLTLFLLGYVGIEEQANPTPYTANLVNHPLSATPILISNPLLTSTTISPRKVPLPLETDLPNFSAIKNVKQKKIRFFRYLLAYTQAENSRIKVKRDRIQLHQAQITTHKPLRPSDQKWLKNLAKYYKLPANLNPNTEKFYPALLQLVDILPPSMVLAQGANESGWGGSRFAKKGNNLFGEWCHTKGCGLVPLQRQKGYNHEVARFGSVTASVQAYYHNINSHPAYAPLRKLREKLRHTAQPITGMTLGEMLTPYSQRGAAYVKSIQNMIRINDLSRFDSAISYPGST
jgi:Bax protein